MPWYQVTLPLTQTANMGKIQERFFAAHTGSRRSGGYGYVRRRVGR